MKVKIIWISQFAIKDQLPIVMMSVNTFCAQKLTKRHADATKAPAIVTARQPYLFTNEDEIGPMSKYEKRKVPLVRLIDFN